MRLKVGKVGSRHHHQGDYHSSMLDEKLDEELENQLERWKERQLENQ